MFINTRTGNSVNQEGDIFQSKAKETNKQNNAHERQ